MIMDFKTTMVAGKDGWIVAVDVSNGEVTMRIPVSEINCLKAAINRSYIDATERCEWCSGSGRVDIGDSTQYMDEHYVDCDKCKGNGRLQKNIVPRIKCKYESTETPTGRGWYCMVHCANPKSPLHGKTCEDHLRRDCTVKESVPVMS